MENTFHQRIASGEPTLGTHMLFSDPDIPELVGDTGIFDYVEYAAEYSILDMQLLYHFARSAQCGNNLPLMIKLDQESQGFWAQAAIGAGFKSVLFTDIRSPADVDACYQCIRPDTPTAGGKMGVKIRRNCLQGYDAETYLPDLESIVLAIMIEKDVAYQNIDAVLQRAKERGVALTQWGPADFGFSKGRPGIVRTKEIEPFEETVIEKSLAYGIQPRIEIGSLDQAKRYLDLGVRHFCIGWDRFIYLKAVSELGNGMRKLLESA